MQNEFVKILIVPKHVNYTKGDVYMKRKLIAILMAGMVCFNLSAPALALGTCNDVHLWMLGAGYCNGDGVNIRTGPGKRYPSVGMSYYGDGFNHYQTERDSDATYEWIHVHGGHIGWIHMDYYTEVEAARSAAEASEIAQQRYFELGEAAKVPVVYEVA